MSCSELSTPCCLWQPFCRKCNFEFKNQTHVTKKGRIVLSFVFAFFLFTILDRRENTPGRIHCTAQCHPCQKLLKRSLELASVSKTAIAKCKILQPLCLSC